MSENFEKIAEALAKAQGQMVNPEPNRTVDVPGKDGKRGYSFNYADLAAITNTIKKPLSENGICYTFVLDEKLSTLECRLIHSSGQFFSSSWVLARNPDPKQMAGSITYAKRYLLSGLVGIAADEDKDGEPDEGATYSVATPKSEPHQSNTRITPKPAINADLDSKVKAEFKKTTNLMSELKISKEDLRERIHREYGIDDATKLSLDQLKGVVAMLEKESEARKIKTTVTEEVAPWEKETLIGFLGG